MFISFEGMDGSGKTTLLNLVSQTFKHAGIQHISTREPGGSRLGKKLRALLLNTDHEPPAKNAELFLFLADRAQHVKEVIEPALRGGKIVLCDRFLDSTLAYQGYGRGMDINKLALLHNCAVNGLNPDKTFLLDLPTNLGIERATRRNDRNSQKAESRFDTENINFHERVRNGYRELAMKNPERIIVLDATQSEQKVLQECLTHLRELFPDN